MVDAPSAADGEFVEVHLVLDWVEELRQGMGN